MDDLSGLSDESLEQGLRAAASDERRDLVAVLRHLQEFERRDLDRRKGFGSMFAYCMSELRYSEDAAAKRIQVARKARAFPRILKMLASGELHLSGACLLAPFLTEENSEELLSGCRLKPKRKIEFFLAERFPQAERRESVRPVHPIGGGKAALPPTAPAEGRPSMEASGDAPPLLEPYPVAKPFAPDRVRFEFNGSRQLYDKIERAKQLLRHKYPFCTLEQLFGESLESLLDDWDPERRMARKKPSSAAPKPTASARADPQARTIPQSVKDEVYRRDGGQCAFMDGEGRRCQERGALEYDHVVPHALGGLSVADNLRLLCEGHNRYEARRRFGAWVDGVRQPDAKRGRPEGTPEGELPMSG